MPFVSIVTPFFNTEQYLAECIESVISQSFEDWEYILLDNCSTDGSLSIARDYAAVDSRIRVVESSKFIGQIPNYNRALRCISADSRYTKIVEADNWIYPECVEKMIQVAEADDTIRIVGSYNVTEHAVRFTGVPQLQRILSGSDIARLYFLGSAYPFGSPTTVLYRSADVRRRQPFFPEDDMHAADLRAGFEILREGSFGFVHQILTFVRTDNESILTESKDFDCMTLDRLVVFQYVGGQYFDKRDYQAILQLIAARQYRILAFGLLTGKGIKFWRFHISRMVAAGQRVSFARLFVTIMSVLLEWALNPGYFISAMFRRLRGARSDDK